MLSDVGETPKIAMISYWISEVPGDHGLVYVARSKQVHDIYLYMFLCAYGGARTCVGKHEFS